MSSAESPAASEASVVSSAISIGLAVQALRAVGAPTGPGRHTGVVHTWIKICGLSTPDSVDAAVAATARSDRAFDALVEVGLGRGLVTGPLVGALLAELGRRAAGGALSRASG